MNIQTELRAEAVVVGMDAGSFDLFGLLLLFCNFDCEFCVANSQVSASHQFMNVTFIHINPVKMQNEKIASMMYYS